MRFELISNQRFYYFLAMNKFVGQKLKKQICQMMNNFDNTKPSDNYNTN